jgi:phage tail tape-measure protein
VALKFAMILEWVSRGSAKAKQAIETSRKLAKGTRDLARESGPAARGMDRVSNAAGRMRARLGPALTRVKELAGRAGMKALEKSAYGAGYAIGWTIRKVATLALGLAKLTAGAAGLAGGAFLGGVIATTAKFEQFQIMLEGTEGSAEKAKRAMDWVRDFAKTTPYELEQVMQAFVQLKAYGIDPLDGSLVAAGDAAAGMSKDLMQAVEALADAQTGEFERLKEFGIRARVEGNKVAFTYMKNGKEITRQTTKSAVEMKNAITGIWSDRFGGSMERQSKTFNGMISNLKDSWSDFMLRVGQAGVFDKVKGKLQGVLDWLNARLDDG